MEKTYSQSVRVLVDNPPWTLGILMQQQLRLIQQDQDT